jgi:alcohol dehydrogenase class IV
MHFEFATSNRIIFGPESWQEAVPYAQSQGRRICLVTGSNPRRAESIIQVLKSTGLSLTIIPIDSEPTIEMIEQASIKARENQCDVVIGYGGGSVIDSGKAISALLTNHGSLTDYLEVIGKGKPLKKKTVPCIAIPTTAGTGTEVTRNAVITSVQHKVKVSMRSPSMLPNLAIVDPTLTYDLAPEITAFTGLDALTQLIEAFVSRKANPMTDSLCVEGIARAARALPLVYKNGHDAQAREEMSLASLFSGLALANAGLGAVHGFAGPIGGLFSAPHGAVCACLLPYVMETNIDALQRHETKSGLLKRFHQVARLLTGDSNAKAERAIKWLQTLCNELHVPPLSSYGIDIEHIPMIIEGAKEASSMKGNPVTLTDTELIHIMKSAL